MGNHSQNKQPHAKTTRKPRMVVHKNSIHTQKDIHPWTHRHPTTTSRLWRKNRRTRTPRTRQKRRRIKHQKNNTTTPRSRTGTACRKPRKDRNQRRQTHSRQTRGRNPRRTWEETPRTEKIPIDRCKYAMSEDEVEEAQLEELRRRRMNELQQRLAQEQQRAQAQQQVEMQKQAILRRILTPKARQRISNLKMVKPEFASMLELQLIQLAQAGRVQIPITDEQLREILIKLQQQRRDIKITRR